MGIPPVKTWWRYETNATYKSNPREPHVKKNILEESLKQEWNA